ncbi:MAG: hypothetical protein ACI4GV_05700 [Acutalibacteraceae bacterium]
MKTAKYSKKIIILFMGLTMLCVCVISYILSEKNNKHIEPITIDECGEIYNENKEDFEFVKDYVYELNSLSNNSSNISIYFSLNNEIEKYIDDTKVREKCYYLRDVGVRAIKVYNNPNSNNQNSEIYILFYINGTESSYYGVLWRNNQNKFATVEKRLSENWYSYFIGYT